MKRESYAQYLDEMDNWLHRSRADLLTVCLSTVVTPTDDLPLQVLEVGAGDGRNTDVLARFGDVDAVEIDPLGIERLQNNQHVRQIYTDAVPFPLEHTYDIICAMDVIEHVPDDRQVFDWMVEHLAEGGTLFVTVPAFPFLFSRHDVALNHYRRYRVAELIALGRPDLTVVKRGYFVFLLFPIVMLQRLADRLRASRLPNEAAEKHTSDVHPAVDRILYRVLSLELRLLRRLPLYPFGLTAFAVFRK